MREIFLIDQQSSYPFLPSPDFALALLFDEQLETLIHTQQPQPFPDFEYTC
jgi:hypothetical protein